MRLFNRFWAIFIIAVRRILSQPWMALATVLGMIFAISLTMSVPLYASSVYNSIFLQQVGLAETEDSSRAYPPFAFLFTYDTNILGNLQWPDVERINRFLEEETAPMLGLPVSLSVRYFSTNPMAMFPGSTEQFPVGEQPLLWSSIGSITGIAEHVQVLEGRFPEPASGPDEVVEVMITGELALELGIQTGEEYALFARGQSGEGGKSTLTIPVRVVGVFQASDPRDDFWFIRPELLKERLIVPEETYINRISPTLSDEIYGAFWYMVMDGTSVRPEQAMSAVRRIVAFQQAAGQHLPRIKLSVSPVDALYAYQRAANLLTVLLFAFSVPIFALLLAFITMTAGMTVERQRNEIAVLRSRGAEVAQMLGIAAVEGLLLGLLALAASLPVSAGIAWAIGRTRSFLDFSSETGLELVWNATTYSFGIAAILVTLLARLWPTLRAAQSNIILYKRERARSLEKPLWQRLWLDVLLLFPAGYGIYQLSRSGSIDVLGATQTGDPFTNPLLIMVPALAIFALSLLFLRLLPLMMRAAAWAAGQTRSVGIMMAARHLARTPGTYALPLVLLILTLSLSAFTATLAGTLDHHLYEQVYYQVGSDVNFRDLGDSPESTGAPVALAGAQAASGSAGLEIDNPNPPGWFFLPVTDYLSVPGVRDATRVGRYQATAILGSRTSTGDVIGVDRYNLPNIAFWRSDFADDSLGGLMNRLAAQPDGLLVPRELWAAQVLSYGDLITLRVVTYSGATEVDFHAVGHFDLFPTYYPGDEPLFVANLDYLFQELGGEYPYDVWLETGSEPVDVQRMSLDALTMLGARTISWREAPGLIASQQTRPERQGLFGVLSVGFSAAALLTVLGFLLYALLSYQRRFVELGVLRAVGLSAGQMTAFLAAELAFLIFSGGLIGTGLGVWISNMFIPYLQVGADAAAQIPPYVVYVAWPAILRVYALFGLLFIVALAALVILLRRMRIFQAIKMGESV